MSLAEVLFAACHKSGYDRNLQSQVLFKITHFEQDGVHQRIV
jgi:hypothetical protein